MTEKGRQEVGAGSPSDFAVGSALYRDSVAGLFGRAAMGVIVTHSIPHPWQPNTNDLYDPKPGYVALPTGNTTMAKAAKRAALYVRVSTDHQSVENQTSIAPSTALPNSNAAPASAGNGRFKSVFLGEIQTRR